MDYYSHINFDLLNRIPLGAKRILEVGCGRGKLAEAYKKNNPETQYWGIEINADAAKDAARVMDGVFSGDIESKGLLNALEEKIQGVKFDAIILGDILEHLRDPWDTLIKLFKLSKPGATCIACLPNVAHWTIFQQLLNGLWTYEESGLLDKTHLRFFTLSTAREMFSEAGWEVTEAYPLIQGLTEAERHKVQAFLQLAGHLGIDQEKAKADFLAYQWIITGVKH